MDWEGTPKYEAMGIMPETPLARCVTNEWLLQVVPFPDSKWLGPLKPEVVENARARRNVFVAGFGDPPDRPARARNTPKKYTFVCVMRNDRQDPDTGPAWCRYRHCKSGHDILLRRVSPHLNVDVEMREWRMSLTGGPILRTKCEDYYPKGTTVTAVAANGGTIYEVNVETDMHAGDSFKPAVKRKCIELGLCSAQTAVHLYHNGMLLRHRSLIRGEYRLNFLKPIEREPEFVRLTWVPRSERPVPPALPVAPASPVAPPTKWSERMEMILEGKTPTAADYSSNDEAPAEEETPPPTKKQKTEDDDDAGNPGRRPFIYRPMVLTPNPLFLNPWWAGSMVLPFPGLGGLSTPVGPGFMMMPSMSSPSSSWQ